MFIAAAQSVRVTPTAYVTQSTTTCPRGSQEAVALLLEVPPGQRQRPPVAPLPLHLLCQGATAQKSTPRLSPPRPWTDAEYQSPRSAAPANGSSYVNGAATGVAAWVPLLPLPRPGTAAPGGSAAASPGNGASGASNASPRWVFKGVDGAPLLPSPRHRASSIALPPPPPSPRAPVVAKHMATRFSSAGCAALLPSPRPATAPSHTAPPTASVGSTPPPASPRFWAASQGVATARRPSTAHGMPSPRFAAGLQAGGAEQPAASRPQTARPAATPGFCADWARTTPLQPASAALHAQEW